VEQDGVLVTITLDRNPMPAGEPTWLTAEVKNTGRDDLEWMTDGCQLHVLPHGELIDLHWRPGVQQHGRAAAFKDWALHVAGQDEEGIIHLGFASEDDVERGRFEGAGCADIGMSQRLPPGGVLGQRFLWSGEIAGGKGPPPTASVDIIGTFSHWRREGEPEEERRPDVVALLRAWVVGPRDPFMLSPAEAVDIALADPRLAGWIAQGWGRRSGAIVWRDGETGSWWVGMTLDDNDLRLAVVDATQGRVVDYVRARDNNDGTWELLAPG
jgi:hypothetical protein